MTSELWSARGSAVEGGSAGLGVLSGYSPVRRAAKAGGWSSWLPPTAPQQGSHVSHGAAAAPEEGKARSAGAQLPSAASITKQGTWPSPGSRWAGTHKGK